MRINAINIFLLASRVHAGRVVVFDTEWNGTNGVS